MRTMSFSIPSFSVSLSKASSDPWKSASATSALTSAVRLMSVKFMKQVDGHAQGPLTGPPECMVTIVVRAAPQTQTSSEVQMSVMAFLRTEVGVAWFVSCLELFNEKELDKCINRFCLPPSSPLPLTPRPSPLSPCSCNGHESGVYASCLQYCP